MQLLLLILNRQFPACHKCYFMDFYNQLTEFLHKFECCKFIIEIKRPKHLCILCLPTMNPKVMYTLNVDFKGVIVGLSSVVLGVIARFTDVVSCLQHCPLSQQVFMGKMSPMKMGRRFDLEVGSRLSNWCTLFKHMTFEMLIVVTSGFATPILLLHFLYSTPCLTMVVASTFPCTPCITDARILCVR